MSEPHVISALREKRAELSGELIQTEKRLIQIRADLDSLDGAIRVFDPSLVPTAIRPRIKRKPSVTFRHGEFSRTTLCLLRRSAACKIASKRYPAEKECISLIVPVNPLPGWGHVSRET
jgi:hypothetical protein